MVRVARLFSLVLALSACGNGSAPPACAVDGECPLHQYCDGAARRCVSGCLAGADCPDGTCDAHGRCTDGVPAGDGATGSDAATDDLASSTSDLAGGAPDLSAGDGATCPAGCTASGEPNDTPAQASAISDAVTLSSVALCPAGDVDWYKITATRRGTLDVYLTNGACASPLRVDVIDADGATPVGASASTTPGWHASAPVRVGEVRYLRVQALTSGTQNDYTLQVMND